MADTTPGEYQRQDLEWLRFTWWLFLGVVFLVKLSVVWQLKDHPLLHPDAGLDTTAYVNLARRVVAGDLALGPGLYFVSPLYIYFLAAGLWLFDSFTAVRVVQIALGTASVALIYLTARHWFGTRAAWVAAVLAAATGLLTFYESLILQASIDAFLTSLALWLLTAHGKGDRHHLSRDSAAINGASPRFRTLLGGVVFALATLNRPNMIFGAGAVLLTLVALRRWRPAAWLVAGLMIGFTPSLARNVAVAGEWSLVSSHGGLNLYIGNNERASGFYREVPGIRPLIEGQQEDTRRVASAALGREVTDVEASGYFRMKALEWMIGHPFAAMKLFAKKLYFTFQAQHVALPQSYPFFAYEMDTALQFLVVGPWLLVPLGLLGLVAPKFFPEEFPLMQSGNSSGMNFAVWVAFVPGYAVGVALFFVAERYRMPLFVPLAIGAGGFVDFAWRAIRARRVRALALPAAAALALAVAVNWPHPLNDGRWDDGLRTAQRLVITGNYDEADAWVERLERNAPRPGRAHHGVGLQLVLEDQPGRALRHLKRSLELGFAANDDVEMWLRLGRLSSRTESPASAEPFFRRAVQIKPDLASARQQYGLNLLLLDRIEDAKKELEESARLKPDDVDTLSHLAYCEIKLGHLDEARRHVRAALALKPDDELSRKLAAAVGLR